MKISKDQNVRDVVHIFGDAAGPRVVMFAGIHGDEVSGVHAIEKLLFDFFVEKRTLLQGSLTLARGNEQALAEEQRYIKHNLNRMFRETYGPEIDKTSYEYRRAQELKTVLQNCDYFLDMHSAPTAQEPFLVAETGSAVFYAKLGIPRIMTGWSKFASRPIGGDAENWGNRCGAKSATLESGSHFERSSIDIANRAVISLLSLLGMIESATPLAAQPAELYDVYTVVTKDFEDFHYTGEVKNFRFFKKNETFAFQNGRPMTVTEDSYLLIPMTPADTKIGEEVCYLGRKLAA
jgi:uncharacterized protein